MRDRGMLRLMALGAGVVSVAPAIWWVFGRFGGDGVDAEGADYFWRPPDLTSAAELAIGVGALLSVGCAGAMVAMEVRAGTSRRTLVGVVAPFATLFAFIGFLYRVATEPVIGANIGAGILMLVAGPVAVGVLVWGVIAIRNHRRSADQPTIVRSKT